MANTIVICGYGPAISHAVAHRFGKEGYRVALVARQQNKLDAAVSDLSAAGIEAHGFSCDLSDPVATAALFPAVRAAIGPVTMLHWNAHSAGAGDLTSCELSALQASLNVAVTSLVAAVQCALPDLQAASGRAAVLVTGGGLSRYSDEVDRWSAERNTMGLAVAKAAQHKLVGQLHAKLAPLGIFVGGVTVLGLVKGSAYDNGHATVEPSDVAAALWEAAQKRDRTYSSAPGN